MSPSMPVVGVVPSIDRNRACQPAQSHLGLLAPADLIIVIVSCLAWLGLERVLSPFKRSAPFRYRCCGPSLQATSSSSSTSCFFTFPHPLPLLADLGGWSNKATSSPALLCRSSSEPLICLHDWSLGCVSSLHLASLPHVGVLLISARKATSVACYSLGCAHELEA
jgi:hypothetical protein